MSEWVTVGTLAELRGARNKLVVMLGEEELLVLAHGDRLYAFANRCVHKQRELAKGVVLNGKLVCPGHQWAFELESGYEAVKDACQPTFDVRVTGDTIEVSNAPRPITLTGPADLAAAQPEAPLP